MALLCPCVWDVIRSTNRTDSRIHVSNLKWMNWSPEPRNLNQSHRTHWCPFELLFVFLQMFWRPLASTTRLWIQRMVSGHVFHFSFSWSPLSANRRNTSKLSSVQLFYSQTHLVKLEVCLQPVWLLVFLPGLILLLAKLVSKTSQQKWWPKWF